MTKFIGLTILMLSVAVVGYAAPKEKAPKPAIPQTQPVPANKIPAAAAPISPIGALQLPRYILFRTTCSFPEPTRRVYRVKIDPSWTGTFPPASDLNFDTLSSPELRKWVSSLPKGSVIVHTEGGPNRVASYTDPVHLARIAEIEDFTKFCKDKGVNFIYSSGLF